MSYSSNLFRLQQIDTQLDITRNRVEEIDRLIAQDSELKQAQQDLEKANNDLSEEEKKLHAIEGTVKAQKIKIEQTEAKLYGGKIHNPKELQDLQNESQALNRYLVILEERQLEAMISLEDTEEIQKIAAKEYKKTKSLLESQFSLLNGEKLDLIEQIRHLESDRQIVANMVHTVDLATYDQLRTIRRGIAVAAVIDKSCSACGSTLTAALIQTAQTAPTIVRCPTCSRIIYPG